MDSKHAKEIQLIGFNWGETQPASLVYGTGGGSGAVERAVTQPADATNPAP